MLPLKKIVLLAAMLPAMAANAQVAVRSASTYVGLNWVVSTSAAGLQNCTQLVLDATGASSNSANYVTYGQLYCPALGGGYASSGNLYFDSGGLFHMTASFGVTYQLVCDNLNGSSLSGSCPIYNYQGSQVGSAFVSLR